MKKSLPVAFVGVLFDDGVPVTWLLGSRSMGRIEASCAASTGFLLAVFFVHLATLNADPPKVPNGQGGLELVVEGPAKAHEARRYARTGTFAGNPADNYRIWGVQSPAYVRPLGWALRSFGPTLSNVRLYGIVVSCLGTLLLWLLVSNRLRGWALFVVLLLSSSSFYAFHYARAGLLEPQVNTLLLAAALCCVLAFQKSPLWLIGALFAWVGAFLTKQSAVVFLPALSVAFVAATRQAMQRQERLHAWLPWLAALVVGAILGAYVSSDPYRQTLSWNYSHAVQGTESMLRDPVDWWHELERFRNVFDRGRWKQAVLWVAPVAFPLAVLQLMRIGVRCLRRNRPSPLEWILALWFLGSLVALFAIAHARGRFSTVLLPPAFAMAGLEIDAWLRNATAIWRKAALLAVFSFFAATHLGWHSRWARQLHYELHEGTERMADLVGPDDVVVGRWAPVLTFGTRAESFYVKHNFNTDRASLSALGVTHLLGEREGLTGRILSRRFPDSLYNAKQIAMVELLGRRLPLFELTPPLGSTEKVTQ
jgi:hypothetical protein